jgi:hypothetical protein
MNPDRTPSRTITIRAVRRRQRKQGTRFTVDGRPHHRSFHERPPADAWWRELHNARSEGELFDSETGLPLSALRRMQPDLVILDRAAYDRLTASASRGNPMLAAGTVPSPASWEELFAKVPYARAAAKRRDDILDTRRRGEVRLETTTQVGFITTWEQEFHLIVDVAELDERAPGWRDALDRPEDYGTDGHLRLRMLLGEHLGDTEALSELL